MAKNPKAQRSKKTARGKTMDAKAAQQEAAQEHAAKAADTTLTMPTTNDVQNLARRCRSFKKQSREIGGQIGEMISKAAENKSLDRRAFSIARGLDEMSPEKLRVTYLHLLRYMDDLDIPARAIAQAEMFDDGEGGQHEDGEARGENSGDPEQTNVAHGDFRRRMKEAQGPNYMKTGAPAQVETEARTVPEAAGAS